MWLGTANSGGRRSPQASAGTPNNTREPAQTGKKKPQLITVGAPVLVEAASTDKTMLHCVVYTFLQSPFAMLPPKLPPAIVGRCAIQDGPLVHRTDLRQTVLLARKDESNRQ
jgi:hypothetical protein